MSNFFDTTIYRHVSLILKTGVEKLLRSFGEYKVRRDLREQEYPTGQGVGPGLGHINGQPDQNGTDGGFMEFKRAFQDIVPILEKSMSGPSGKAVINDIVSAVMNNPQVPTTLKQELKAKITGRWSAIVDINQGESPTNKPGVNGFGMDGMQNMPSPGGIGISR